jgi:hypothetical protein
MVKAFGIGVLLFSLVALGTWPALLDLSCSRGRHPSHAYLDYATVYLCVAAVIAIVSGQPLAIDGATSALLAAGGGFLLMLGNLSMQRALIMGVPLSIVLPMQGSLTVVLGTTINYFLQPHASQPQILAAGVGAFLLAIFVSAAAHIVHERDTLGRRQRRRRRRTRPKGSCCAEAEEQLITVNVQPGGLSGLTENLQYGQPEGLAPTSAPASAMAEHHVGVAGLCVAAYGGVCFGGFSPLFNIAVNDELGWIAASGGTPLPVFAANLYFCAAFALSAWVANLALMRWPPTGTERSSASGYVRGVLACDDRGLAALAGAVCALGNGAQFWGGTLAGFAAADMVQAFPLVGTIWGVACLGEFRRASRRVYGLLIAMYGSFVAAVVLLAVSVRTHDE